MIINLHGKLGKKYGNRHSFKVRNSKEAVEALSANFSGFKQDLVRLTQKGIYYKSIVSGGKTCKHISDYYEKCEEIDIIPSVIGGGVAGLILAGAGAVGIGMAAEISFLVYIGIGLILQGIMMLLFPFEFDKKPDWKLKVIFSITQTIMPYKALGCL